MIWVNGNNITGLVRLSALAALLISLVYILGVGWHADVGVAQTAPETPLGVVLRANQEVPAVTSPSTAKGEGTVTVSADQTTISYTLTLTGPLTGDAQMAHIHAGATGSSGPVIFFLCAADPAAAPGVQPCPPAAGGEISGTLTEAEFMPQPDAGVATFADAVAALGRGGAYMNVHTVANSSGEIRGQIGSVGLGSVLSSAAESPPVTTPSSANGTFTVALLPDQSGIDYKLTLNGPFTGDPQVAHIHVGQPGAAGPPLFFLCAADPTASPGVQPCPPAAGGEISGTLTEAEFTPQPADGIETFSDAIDALLSGGAYVNVHTPANTSGEIRGQIGVAVQAELSSAAEVPPVTTPSTATGTALAVLNKDHSQIDYAMTLTGPFTGDPQVAHIHAGLPDASGPPIFFLCAVDPAASPGVQACPPAAGGMIIGTLTETELAPQPDAGVATFADAVAAMLRGGTYVNVHTPSNTSGEIRGQLDLVQPEAEPPVATVSFAMDIQPIFNNNCSCHLSGTPAGLSLAEGQAYANLVNVPSSQVPTLNRVTPGDPDNSYLFMKHSGAPGIVNSRMPLNNPTFFDENPDLLELERQWIQGGALDN
jgi:methylglyoxal synthase